jgi:hypothetical protein
MEDIREREEKLEAVLREYALKSPELAESLKKMRLSRFNFCLQRPLVRDFVPGAMEISRLKTAIFAHFSLLGD